MIDHVGFAVSDIEPLPGILRAALAPLGISLIMSVAPDKTESGGTALGFGSDGKPFFWIGDNERSGEGTACRLHGRRTAPRSTHSTRPRWPPADATMAPRAFVRIITPTIMPPSSSIPTGSISRRFATSRT